MRIQQPTNCDVTTQILRRVTGQFEVSVALWQVFSLAPDCPESIDSSVLWKLVKDHWGSQAFDEGFSKRQGEFLCFGKAYPPPGLSKGPFGVSVRVGPHKHNLAVYGARVFGVLGAARELVAPREPIAISPANAFGGKAFADNPLGVGYLAASNEAAPCIEDPDFPIGSSDATNQAAGFWPRSPAHRERQRYLGTFGEHWLTHDWPNFPPDTDMAYFQTAPLKQRLEGYFKANESGEVVGMNEHSPRLPFTLPDQRARCVYRIGEQAGMFEGWCQAPINAETLFLFPNEAVGALLHRAVIRVDRADALDLRDILLTLESSNSATRPDQMVMQRWQSEVLEPLLTETVDQVATSAVSENMAGVGMTDPKRQDGPAQNSREPKRVTQAGRVRLSPEFEQVLSQAGFSEETAQSIRRAEDPYQALSQIMKRQINDAREAYEGALKDSGLSEQAYLEMLKQTPETAAATNHPQFSGQIGIELGIMAGFVDTLVDTLRAAPDVGAKTGEGAVTPLGATMPLTPTAPTAQTTPTTVTYDIAVQPVRATTAMQQFVAEQAQQPDQFKQMNISGLCFAGISLVGIDFTGAIAEETDFTDCDLSRSVLKDTILTRANFTGAKLVEADLTGTTATQAVFDRADLERANLTEATLTDCSAQAANFAAAQLVHCQLDHSNLTDATFTGAKADFLSVCEARLKGCDFSDAQLERADFMKAQIVRCQFDRVCSDRLDFSGAVFEDCRFTAAQLSNCVAMLKASLTGCVFDQCDLTGMSWSSAVISDTSFEKCQLMDADLSSGHLRRSRFVQCKASGLSVFSSELEEVIMLQNNLMDASFHGAKIKASSLLGNNFFSADFIETVFDEQTKLEGNVTLKTILAVRGHPSAN